MQTKKTGDWLNRHVVITRAVRENLNDVRHTAHTLNAIGKKYSIREGTGVLFIGMDSTRARLVCRTNGVLCLVLFPTDKRLGTRRLLAELVIKWVQRCTIEKPARQDFNKLVAARKRRPGKAKAS